MKYTLWNHKTLLRMQFNRLAFNLNYKSTVDNVEKFVFVVVLVPMKLSL